MNAKGREHIAQSRETRNVRPKTKKNTAKLSYERSYPTKNQTTHSFGTSTEDTTSKTRQHLHEEGARCDAPLSPS